MDQTILLWILGFLVTGNIGVAVGLAYHIHDCRIVHSELAQIRTAVGRVERELGSHETGIIGQLHRHTKSIIRLSMKVGLEQ